MNLLKELAQRYGSIYSENSTTEFQSPIGKFSFQPMSEKFLIDESRFSINFNEIGGKATVGKLLNITLLLSESNQSELLIYPKSIFGRMRDSVFGNYKERVESKCAFQGDEILIANLISNKTLLSLLGNENIMIKIGRNEPDRIILTPKNGIDSFDKFEKYLSILKFLEKKVIQLHMTSQIAS